MEEEEEEMEEEEEENKNKNIKLLEKLQEAVGNCERQFIIYSLHGKLG